MNPMWRTWRHGDIRYLAVADRDGHWLIVDDAMRGYGTFREIPKPEDLGSRYPSIGRVLSIMPLIWEQGARS